MSDDPRSFYQLESRIAKASSQADAAWAAYRDALDDSDTLRALQAPARLREAQHLTNQLRRAEWEQIEDELLELERKRYLMITGRIPTVAGTEVAHGE